jgi:hypothetical protein
VSPTARQMPGEAAARQGLPWLTALETVAADPVRLVRVVQAADDRDDALRAVVEAFGLTADQASVVLDNQFGMLVGSRRTALAEELEVLRAPWREPLELDLRIRGRRAAVVVVDGTEHRFRAGGLQSLLAEVAEFLQKTVAEPQLRPVQVTTGLSGDWPRLLRISPSRMLQYEYADDPG